MTCKIDSCHGAKKQLKDFPAITSSSFPRVNNIKVHVQLTLEGRDRLRWNLKHSNLGVVRHANISVCRQPLTVGGLHQRRVYIIFDSDKRSYVNITGIRDFVHLDDVVPQFCLFFSLLPSDLLSLQPHIDNISAAGVFNRRIDLNCLQEKIRGLEVGGERATDFTIVLNRNKFPGAACRSTLVAKGFGTITLFSSGKYIIVGSKCRERLDRVFQRMCAIIATL